MSFREMIDAMLSAHGAGIDPATVLEQHGMGDLPPDALSSALLHFSERAPLDVADALAPVVTRFSPVPFGPDDLAPSPVDDVIDQGGDVLTVLAEVDLTVPPDPDGHLGDHDHDPRDFDHDDGDVGVDDHGSGAGDHDVPDHLHDVEFDHADAGDAFGGGHDPFDLGHDDPDDHIGGFHTDSPVDDVLDAFDHHTDDRYLPLDDTPEFDPIEDIDDTPDESLHEGLEDLAVSMSDMNVEIDRISHDPSIEHFDL